MKYWQLKIKNKNMTLRYLDLRKAFDQMGFMGVELNIQQDKLKSICKILKTKLL